LTEPDFTRRYWNTAFETDWHVGSTMTWDHLGERIADPDQVVLKAEPYRQLSYTWHTFTAGWAEAAGISGEVLAKRARERRSKVTFDIEALEQGVKLTVVHDGFDPGSTVLELVSQGWPQLLSDLKTLLETGATVADLQPASTAIAS
jgi:uncharacterized protein YndB with AHSA1/START domain